MGPACPGTLALDKSASVQMKHVGSFMLLSRGGDLDVCCQEVVDCEAITQ